MRLGLVKEFLCVTLVVATALWAPTVSAQEDDIFCSGDDIAEALDGLECSADGIYLSPEAAADEVSYRCGEAATERTCRACFNKARAKLQVAFRALAKAGLLDRSAVKRLKSTFARVSDETCTNLDEDPPLPEDPEDSPAPSPDQPEPPRPPEHDEPPVMPSPEYTPWFPQDPSDPGQNPGDSPAPPPMPTPGFDFPTPPFPDPELTPPPMPTWDPSFSQPWFPEPELTPPPMPTSDPDLVGPWFPEPPTE